MTRRTIGIDLAIRGDQVAQIFEDGHPVGKPIRFRIDPAALDAFVAKATEGLFPGASVQVLMEPTGMSWFPIGTVSRMRASRSSESKASASAPCS